MIRPFPYEQYCHSPIDKQGRSSYSKFQQKKILIKFFCKKIKEMFNYGYSIL